MNKLKKFVHTFNASIYNNMSLTFLNLVNFDNIELKTAERTYFFIVPVYNNFRTYRIGITPCKRFDISNYKLYSIIFSIKTNERIRTNRYIISILYYVFIGCMSVLSAVS